MQNRRALFFFGLAIFFGIAAAFTARHLLENRASQAAAPVATVPVVVARTDVAVGTSLVGLQLDTVQWPRDYVPAGSFDDPSKLSGRRLRRPIARREAIVEPTLLPIGSQAGLQSVIETAKRAISVKVDPVVSVAGFVTPGTRVDVLSTLRKVDGGSGQVPYTKVILQDLAVLAIDQKLEQAKNGDPQLVSVVTLEVTPKQSQDLTYAAHDGRLQLALRGPGDHEEVKTEAVSASALLGGVAPAKSKARLPQGPSVQVITGSSVSVKSF